MQYTSKEVYELISTQSRDPIVEWKTCAVSGTQFPIYQSDLEFYRKISPVLAWVSYEIPTPTLCPEERQRRRICFRNMSKLRKWRCGATWSQIITQYWDPYISYDNAYWWSDSWDAIKFWQDIRRQETFTQQRWRLSLLVPRPATHNLNCENSWYCNMAANSKDCYLVAGCIGNENCMYGHIVWKSDSCLDLLYSKRCSNCYQCVDCLDCTSVLYCVECESCSFCIWCEWLKNKSYCIANKQYTKEEYESMKSQYMFWFWNTSVIRWSCKNINSERVFGDHIIESNQITLWFDVVWSDSSKYLYTVANCTDCMDVCYTWLGGERLYESLFPQGRNLYMTHNCQDNCQDVLYSENCYACSFCFGCIWLRNKQYCIFNKQYSKEEYETNVWKIIRQMQISPDPSLSREETHWGEFFHPSLSLFGYNETMANEYYPISNISPLCEGEGVGGEDNQQNMKRFGYRRSDYSSDPKIPEWVTTLQWDQLASDIATVSDDICKRIILCETSHRPFMIQRAELGFYRKHSIPLPRKHPDMRYEERMKIRPGRTLFLRTCDSCKDEVLSVYPNRNTNAGDGASERSLLYCEKCHKQEVYG